MVSPSAGSRRLMRWALALLVFTVGSAVTAKPLQAQEQNPDSVVAVLRTLRVFLDCQTRCDRDFIMTEIPYVQFVRDRLVSDVYVLLTSLGTGGGGEEYSFTLIGRGRFAARSDTLYFVSGPTDPDAIVREGVTRTLQLALLPYLQGTLQARRLRIVYDAEGETVAADVSGADPWNAWVFDANVDARANVQERSRTYQGSAEFQASRVTLDWKAEFELEGEYRHSQFSLSGGREAINRQRSANAGTVLVRSIGRNFSAGFLARGGFSEYFNHDLAIRVGPAVEYNFIDWADATRNRLTLRYSLGASYFDYSEITVYEKLTELLPNHTIGLAGRSRQPWGSANASLEFGTVLNDLSKNIMSGSISGDVRVGRGLSLRASANASRVRNQLFIPRGELSDEEVLLGRRALETGYQFFLSLGFGYTFGSIYSAVVNPRFGNGINIF